MRILLAAILLAVSASPAIAYIGPGLGIGVISVVLGVLAAIFLLIAGVFWYPIKRLIKGRKTSAKELAKTDTNPE